MSSRPSLEVYKAIEQAHAEQAEALKDVEGIALTTVIQPMSSLAMRETLKNGGTPLGLEPVGQQCTYTPKGEHVLCFLLVANRSILVVQGSSPEQTGRIFKMRIACARQCAKSWMRRNPRQSKRACISPTSIRTMRRGIRIRWRAMVGRT